MSATSGSDRLDGRAGVVTGASTGIGRATAAALAAAGVRVGLAARSTSKLEALADEIEADGGEALVVPTDVRDREQVASLIEAAREAFGGLDLVVNNAGVGHWDREGVVAADLEAWEREVAVNLLGVLYGTHFAAAAMRGQGAGDIVNVGSGAGRHPFPEWPGYVASKYGVRGFTESARRALRDSGVRVTLIEPGEVATPIQPDGYTPERRMLDRAVRAPVSAIRRPGGEHARFLSN